MMTYHLVLDASAHPDMRTTSDVFPVVGTIDALEHGGGQRGNSGASWGMVLARDRPNGPETTGGRNDEHEQNG
jgi:hypothetical protein